jgi:F-type H+-transporting ATPase subunit a
MEHHSILYGPVNRLLLAIFGPPPVAKFSAGWAKFFFPDGAHAWLTDTTIMTFLLTLIIAIVFPLAARKFDRERPGGVQNFLEMIVGSIRSLLADVIGHGADHYLAMIGTFAIFIFLGNAFGLLFPLTPPTSSFSTTVALAFVAFLYFNWQGIKEQGFAKYLWHFTGPSVLSAKPSWLERIVWFPLVLLLFAIFLVVEVVSNFARILSLSLRLFMNISGEHTVTGFFSSLLPIVLPWPLMILGLFTAFLQAFIFVTLTAVYINLSTAHEEH